MALKQKRGKINGATLWEEEEEEERGEKSESAGAPDGDLRAGL